MARHTKRPPITRTHALAPVRRICSGCGGTLWVAYHTARTITTLDDVCRLTVTVCHCHNLQCPRYRQPYRPEAEGAWALPHGEFGLDVIAHIGLLRYRDHRSVPDIHRALQERQVAIAERTVTDLLARYEELVTLHLADQTRLADRLTRQGHVILAIDGLQPHTQQDVLWVLRDCLSGEVLLARSLERARETDLADLLREVKQALPVPIQAVVSDGQHAIRLAVRSVLPEVPHQLCQYHYLKEAAKPIVAADQHAKTQLKQYVRGIRPIEQALAVRDDPDAAAERAYCLAVRSALTDAGHPPLQAPGLVLHDRLTAIQASLARVREKKGFPPSWPTSSGSWGLGCLPRHSTGSACARRMPGWCGPHRSWRTTRRRMAAAVAGAYRALLTDLLAHQTNPALEPFVTHFYNVTMRYWRGLFWCYDLRDVPRTNNDLEQYFGVARDLERRATGRKRPPAGVGVRGSVRVVAAVATRLTPVAAEALQPPEVERWRRLRRALEARQEVRRMQRRFRRDPTAYLVRLEAHLLQ